MRKLKTKKSFDKAYAKLPLKLRQKIDCALVIFVENPWETVLNNHALKGDYLGLRSINVTGDVRILFKEQDNHIEIVLVDVGKHSQLYK